MIVLAGLAVLIFGGLGFLIVNGLSQKKNALRKPKRKGTPQPSMAGRTLTHKPPQTPSANGYGTTLVPLLGGGNAMQQLTGVFNTGTGEQIDSWGQGMQSLLTGY